jgi:hypothetical protein
VLALDIFSTIFGAANTLEQQRLQDQIAEQNIKQREFAARDALQRGNKRASQVKENATRVQAEHELQAAAQGVQLDRGTAAIISDEAIELSERDVQVIKNSSLREAFGHKVDAFQIEQQNEFNNIQARTKAVQTLATGGLKAIDNRNKRLARKKLAKELKTSLTDKNSLIDEAQSSAAQREIDKSRSAAERLIQHQLEEAQRRSQIEQLKRTKKLATDNLNSIQSGRVKSTSSFLEDL